MVSAPQSGAAIVPFLKVWGILPGAVFFSFLYAQLAKRFARETVFYTMVLIFITFFTLFFTVLFPFREEVALIKTTEFLENLLPSAKWIWMMIRYWHLSLFYICSELWGSVVLSMLFWGFVNEVTSNQQAKRFYGIFAVIGNLGSVLAGFLGNAISTQKFDKNMPIGATGWEQSVFSIVAIALICQAAVLVLFYLLSNLPNLLEARKKAAEPTPQEKSDFTLRKAFMALYDSPHLRYIACIVICYNFMFNLIDVIYLDQLHIHFKNDTGSLNAFMSQVTLANGVMSAVIALFFSGSLLRRFGWKTTALATPVVVFLGCIGLFGLNLFEDSFLTQRLVLYVACPVTLLAVYISGTQQCLTRSLKYTLFDATKEMAFIPLSPKEQRQGKAVIDGVGSRFGKSGGSLFYQFLLIFLPSIAATLPYVSILIVLITFAWIYAVIRLNGSLTQRLQARGEAE